MTKILFENQRNLMNTNNISRPICLKANSTNSLTECDSPVAMT